MRELPKAYEPATVEPGLYRDWVDAGLFHAEPDAAGKPFSIVIPPPNVTGSLHVGHALDNTIQDVIVRRERMRGANAVWIPGTDHAGIATQNVVERQLADEGLSRFDLGREAFVERVWAWREESGGVILDQLRQLGASCDWDREVFTFDEPRSRAVREVFVALYEQGLLYRGHRLINWCPRCLTALSDIEVSHSEVEGELVSFRYPAATTDAPEDRAGVIVATTRAETMLGDTAVAVHPDDDRYRRLVGRTLRHPFFDRVLPVIADDYVDPKFGTGAVKITPAHDPNDYAVGERHGLGQIDILTDHAVINDNGGPFAGLDRFAARAAVKQQLDELGLLEHVERHVHSVGHCSRCGTVVEPRLSDQWFVKVRPLADKAAQAVRDGRIRFVPENRAKPFLEWLDNLHDWCISRQIWWGHRIPAWYGPDGEVAVARDDLDRPGWTQDPDVLDTWFSSQLWPFSVFGWPQDTPELATWYPTSTLVTGYDINTFWVSRMAMAALWFLDEVPFRVVHNHGLVRDEHGKKMSKSFGNVIDPLELIAEYGADATRFALLREAAPGTDVPLARDWVEGARRFANKLWNAARFTLQGLAGEETVEPGRLPDPATRTLEDRWILSRLSQAQARVDAAYDGYEWSTACRALYDFAWHEFADWYLEASKIRLYGDDPAAAQAARQVLATVLERLLRLLHPLMPFLTEELWRSLVGSEGGRRSLMVADWPGPLELADPDADNRFDLVADLVTELRRFRSHNSIAPSKRIEVSVVTRERALLADHVDLVAALAGLASLTFLGEAPAAATSRSKVVFATGEAYVELGGLIDLDAERARLAKELDQARTDLRRAEGKLANHGFVTKAPEAVVQKERDRRDDLQRVIAEVEDQLTSLAALAS